MTEPLSPAAARAAQQAAIPDVVIDAVNALLTERASQGSITIHQEEIIEQLESHGFSREQIFERRMLDFEARFEAVGWQVVYDRPAYNESYEAFWRFTAR